MITWWMWFLAALVFGIIEVLTITFVFLMFAIAAIAAGLVDVRTNADALIGKTGYVTQLVGDRDGRIQFSGGEWSARSSEGLIPVGTEVTVVAIDGATAVVQPLHS